MRPIDIEKDNIDFCMASAQKGLMAMTGLSFYMDGHAAHSAFLRNLGLETLAVRMKQYCENAMTVAEYLEQSDKVEKVNYPGLKSDENYGLVRLSVGLENVEDIIADLEQAFSEL